MTDTTTQRSTAAAAAVSAGGEHRWTFDHTSVSATSQAIDAGAQYLADHMGHAVQSGSVAEVAQAFVYAIEATGLKLSR